MIILILFLFKILCFLLKYLKYYLDFLFFLKKLNF